MNNKVIITIFGLIIVALTVYSFVTHDINNGNIRDIKDISKEIQANSLIVEQNTIEIKRLLDKNNL